MRGKLLLAAPLLAALLFLLPARKATAYPVPGIYAYQTGAYNAIAYRNAQLIALQSNALRIAAYQNALRLAAYQNAVRQACLNQLYLSGQLHFPGGGGGGGGGGSCADGSAGAGGDGGGGSGGGGSGGGGGD